MKSYEYRPSFILLSETNPPLHDTQHNVIMLNVAYKPFMMSVVAPLQLVILYNN